MGVSICKSNDVFPLFQSMFIFPPLLINPLTPGVDVGLTRDVSLLLVLLTDQFLAIYVNTLSMFFGFDSLALRQS